MKRILLAILFTGSCVNCFAQAKVHGKITDTNHVGIELVTVAILRLPDSNMVQSGLTNETGDYMFTSLLKGNYILRAFIIGYKENNSFIGVGDDSQIIQNIILKNDGLNLSEVNVSALKKMVEFKNGNVSVNIGDSPLASGNSAWDLLVRLPGVTVDENKTIAIQGRAGVRIMIDDRLQQLSGKQLENLLRSMNASDIEKIEVLKNPPLKYDAEGTGGIIHIRTKKVKLYGFSGNAGYTFSQGFYGCHYGNLNLNYKAEKIVFYSGLNLGSEVYHNDHVFLSKIKTGTTVTELDQRMDHFQGGNASVVNIGLDGLLNKKNTIGFKIEGDFGNGFEKSVGRNYLSDNSLGFSQMRYDTYVKNTWDYINANLNFEHCFDTSGSKLSFSADYSTYYDTYPGTYDNWFLDRNDENIGEPYFFLNNHVIKGDVASSRLDYIKIAGKGITLEAGVKGTRSAFVSRYNLQNLDNATKTFADDPRFTSAFWYNEQLTAGYVNFTKEWKNFSLQAGCRGENTHIEGYGEKREVQFTRNYFNLFPSVNFSCTRGEMHQFQLNYNRRIERPDYLDLTPFIYRNSIFQLYQGNVNLAPEYSNNFEVSHTFAGALSNSFTYLIADNYSMDYTLQEDSSKATIATIGNLSKAEAVSYSLFYEGEIKKWWSLSFNANASYLFCRGQLLGEDYNSEGYFYMASFTNEFLVKNIKMEWNARYIGPRFNGLWYVQPRWGIYLAFKRSFLKEKLNVTLGIDDIFFTMIGANKLKYRDQDWFIRSTNDSRRLKISLNFNFGKIKIQQREVSSNEEEKGRMGC